MRSVRRTVPAPEGLGTEVVGVPAGNDLELELRLEAVMEGVLVTGKVRATAVGECARCLDSVTLDVVADLMELFAYPDRDREADETDDDVRELDGDYIVLEDAVRDAVVPALPFQPVCRADCPGLCSECGARLADDPTHVHESLDTRWAALQGILQDDEKES
jgi:uncharacterized protein